MRPDLVWQLVHNAVCNKLEVKVTADDLKNYARQIAVSRFAQYGMAGMPDDVIDRYADEMIQNEQTRNQIAQQVVDSVMWASLKNAVTVDDKQVTVEQFNELFKAPEA